MGRPPRAAEGGLVYHMLNRANARLTIFEDDGDFAAFERILAEAVTRYAMRLLAYCLMPNHFHLLLWPRGDADLSHFLTVCRYVERNALKTALVPRAEDWRWRAWHDAILATPMRS